jgi:hypothetical protein
MAPKPFARERDLRLVSGSKARRADVKAALSLVVVGMLIGGVGAAAEAASRLKVHRASQGAIRAELSYRQIPDSQYWKHGRFRIWNRGRLVVERRIPSGAVTFGRRPIAVRQLDGTGQPEVLLNEFSGGNGCCWTNWIYTGARRIRAPWRGPPAIRDRDGDGKPEFHGTEPNWWTWGSRGDARLPAKVWTYSAGEVNDVTRSFPAEVQADQADHYAVYQSALEAGNVGGARNGLAAYVADGYTLGQGDAAMAVLQAAVDAGQLDDPGGEVSTSEYVDTLRRLLRDRGYAT